MDHTESLKRNSDFRRVYSKGKTAVGPYLVLYHRKNGRDGNRLGITVSAKLANAVKRNRVRRRIREIVRLHEAEFERGSDIVVVARGRAVNAHYRALEKELLRLMGQLGLKK